MEKWNVHPRVSVNAISTMKWPIEQDIEFFKSVGVEAINVPFFKFADRAEAGIAAVKASGLRGVSMASGGGVLVESGEKTLQLLKPAIDAANALGCPSFYSVSGPTPARMTTDEAYARLVECLQPANAYAKQKGVRLAIEHTSTATRHHGFIHTLADAIDLSRDADIGVTLEFQNCWYERNLDRLFKENVDRFAIVQVSDFLVGEEIKFNRRALGDGTMPLEWLMERILDAGYQGYFDIEILGPAIEAEGYASAIKRSVDWLSTRLDFWGV
jgi:sugar phosphate isomerase/epimerase